MVVHMIPGIKIDDQRVATVVSQAKNHGLLAMAEAVSGNNEEIVMVYLKDDEVKAGTVPEFPFQMLNGVDTVVRVSSSAVSLLRNGSDISHRIEIGNSVIGADLPCLPVIGPCTINRQTPKTIEVLASHGVKHIRGGAHKPRTKAGSFTGLGEKGYGILLESATSNSIESVWTEVMDTSNIDEIKRQRDATKYEGQIVLWVGARTGNQILLRNLGLLDEFVVMLKHGINDTNVDDILNNASWVLQGPTKFDDNGKLVREASAQSGNQKIILCVRGLNADKIDKHTRFRFFPNYGWIAELHQRSWAPVCFDPSHIAGTKENVVDVLWGGLRFDPEVVLIEAGASPVDTDQALSLDQVPDILSLIKNRKEIEANLQKSQQAILAS